MKPRDRKLAILHQLGKESEPIRSSELSEKLGSNFDQRTIRRWLSKLVEEGLIQKTGHTKNARYSAVKRPGRKDDQNLEKNEGVSSCFSSASLKSIQQVSLPLFERQPIPYITEWLESYQPNKSYYLSPLIRKQLAEAGLRASGQDPAGTYAHQIFNRLIIDLSFNSSRLEGNTYSLIDTERLLLHGNSAEDKLDEEKVMIMNHKEAIRYLVDNAAKVEVNYNTICTLHYLLADGLVESSEAGKIRRHGVRVGGSIYIPFEEPSELSKQLELIADKASLIIDPFEQSFFLLVHVSYLQAFIDVNKRTARLCANIPLVKNNLVPLSFNDVKVDDYKLSVIAIYELQDITPLADLFTYSYLRTCIAYDSTVKSMGFDKVRVRYRQERRAVIKEIIIQKLIADELNRYIQNEAIKLVPTEHQKAFIEDIQEDLSLMDESRLAGLGITTEEFQQWFALNA